MDTLVVNGNNINCELKSINEEEKKYEVEMTIVGESQLERFNQIFSEEFNVKIPADDLEFEGVRSNKNYSYTGNMNEDTEIHVTYEIREKTDVDDIDHEHFHSNTAQIAIMNWVRTRALAEIMIENGITTQEEYEKKIEEVGKRDKDDLLGYFKKSDE